MAQASTGRRIKTLTGVIAPLWSRPQLEKLDAYAYLNSDTVLDDLTDGGSSNAAYVLDLAAGVASAPPQNTPPVSSAPQPGSPSYFSAAPAPAQDASQSDADLQSPAATTASRQSASTKPRSTSDFRFVLRPGTGFTGPTTQPAAVGDPAAVGYDAKAIARWDVVPYQTFTDTFHVGVVAFHREGIERVDFSVNGGDWTSVRTITKNPLTDVYEYIATLRAADFADGSMEVRAVAYPTVGEPRVLESLPLSANATGTLKTLARYVSTTGSDTTGDGSEANPYATIMKAAKAIQTANGTGNADGGTIYLKGGDYQLGPYSYGYFTTTVNRWLTVTTAPGVAKSDVRITGSSTFDGLRTKLVKLENVTITGVITSTATQGYMLWTNGCEIVGPGRTVRGDWTNGWADQFHTNSVASEVMNGFSGSVMRNCVVHDIGQLAFGGRLIVNCTARNIDATGTDFHPDVVQLYGNAGNVILYGITATEGINAQGVFSGDNVDATDIAIVDVNIQNNQFQNPWRCLSFAGPTRHLYVKHSSFIGSSFWATEMHFSAVNVVVENTTFSNGPSPRVVAGVTYR